MKNILKDLYQSILKANKTKKTLLLIFLFFYLLAIILVSVKVNYEIYTPGRINNTVNTISDQKDYAVIYIEDQNLAGEIYTVGIYTHKRISLFQYLLAKASPKIDIFSYNPKTDFSQKEDYAMGVLQKDYSIIDALIVAYEAAKLVNPEVSIDYTNQGLLVTAVAKDSKSNLKIGDIILKIGNQSFSNQEEFQILLSTFGPFDEIPLDIKRGEETLSINAKKTVNTNNQYSLRINVHESYVINDATPAFSLSEDLHSTGSSGGAMMTLAIYNALTDGDLTKGLFIIGTGTININGTVGPIGGIKQKIATASMYDVDVFFVGEKDYEEAEEMFLEIKDSFKPSFQLIKVVNFQEILQKLEEINNE